MQALETFKAAFNETALKVFQRCLQEAKQPLPENDMPWYLANNTEATGHLTPAHAKLLQSLSPDWLAVPAGLHWDTPAQTPESRSVALEWLATQLRDSGNVHGWRNEKFSFWPHDLSPNDMASLSTLARHEAFRMERSAFRFLGLHSHAVHINGFTPQGDMWCGRRALSKSVDPGLLDNLAAGGLPAGEVLFECGVREMAEEAGLAATLARTAIPLGQVTTCRTVPEGWHHETLWVYNLTLPEDVKPHNQDGEVSEFVCLSPWEVVKAIEEKRFTVDAACVIAHAVMHA